MPSKKASPQFACANEERPQAVLCFLVVAQKNAESEGNFVPNKKAGPQFAYANEEPAYRSVTPQLTCNLRFFYSIQTSISAVYFVSAPPPIR